MSGLGGSSSGESSRENALVAYRRGDPDAFDLLESALVDAPNDGELLITHAAAAAASGANDPFSKIEGILARAPDWVDGQKALARLKTEFGHGAPLATLERALDQLPDHPRLWMAYIALLGAGNQHQTAAEKVRDLRQRIGDLPPLRLLEARHAGFAGRIEEAQDLLEALPEDVPDLHYELARNSLRLKRLDQAAAAIDKGLKVAAKDVGMWALAEICWRALNDPRHEWLLPDKALFTQVSLGLSEQGLSNLVRAISQLHSSISAPLGQSVIGGTQTRGNLRWREEKVIVDLFSALERELRSFAKSLPDLDPKHPIEVLKSREPKITASWSILLKSEGFHVSHLHNSGLISSALHLQVPKGLDEGEGALELGRPPTDIDLPIQALAKFDAKPGHLVLFPSFLYHGTTRFREGRRLTVAFDAA
jgi:tetratricopeptide (TPR) repeat protein